ncbi:DUF4872 domain-containing protein [Blastococcus sp. CT_GayMR20]|uniref:BtrH N-terminal domain-containing protein n=1 Tax=Blastococcus sp. CT_GayMR20 TaxID=2559609 RepID=UPI0010732373|nr:BtrH N-terminal domain-containing protein [Blastococcus sp. CT_GayMR20]TFV86345.1 DUF4872 domain-containing protein [Blastococcus sp. CT_GayMR20]
MTSQKHLKAAVRARMARTGERYTTARRHVAGHTAPPPLPGVVPGYRTFGGGRHHDSALLAHVLEATGVTAAHDGRPLTEPMVAGLAGGIGFMYFSFSYAGHVPTMTIVPRIHPRPFLAGALERAGIRHRAAETTSAAKAGRELDAVLDAGRPAICTVVRSALGYGDRLDPFSAADPYDVAVVGRRDEHLLLDDGRLEPNPVPPELLAAARAASRASRHRMLVVEPGGAPVELAGAVRASLAVTLHDLTEDVTAKNFAGNFGLRGLAKWADAVADRGRKTGWSRLFDSAGAHASSMHRLYDCLTTEYSSPGAMRPLYADFLAEAADLLEDGDAARDAGDRYAQAGELWAAIAEAAVAGPMAPYRDLVERRLELLLGGGLAVSTELAAVAEETRAFLAAVEIDEADRVAQLDAIAELASRVVPLEREASEALAEAAVGPRTARA